jgi:hypothetical protein
MTGSANAPANSLAPQPLPRRRRRLILLALVVVAVPVLAVGGYFLWQSYQAAQLLAAAVHEADQLDPGWRLLDLEANRTPVPAEQDAAPVITRTGDRAITILNTGTVRKDLSDVTEPLEKLRPPVALTAQQTARLRTVLQPLAPVLVEARKVVDMPQGRFATNVKPTLNWTLRNVDDASLTIWVLSSDAMLRSQDDDADGAWTNCHAAFNVGRALGDEPVEVVQLTRGLDATRAVRLMERTLAQGTVADKRLATMQTLLEDEMKHPALLIAMRASRGIVDHSCHLLETGEASLAEARRMASNVPGPPGIRDELEGFLDRSSVKPAHAWLLHYLNQAVEIARGPDQDVEAGLFELQKSLAKAPDLVRILAPRFDRMLLRSKATRAILGCALAGLAVERYRLAFDHWPAALDDLVAAKVLPAVPVDPYDGKALRLRAMPDGVVVYSIGLDRRGNGEALDGDALPGDVDRLEFRLWHVERRGQGQ